MKRILLSVFAILIATNLLAVEPWVKEFTPLRTFYVTTNGNGGKILESISGDYKGREDNSRLNGVTFTTGKLNNGVSINGNSCFGQTCNEPYVLFPEPVIFGDNTFAINGWVKPDVNTEGIFFVAYGSANPNADARVTLELINTGQLRGSFKDDAGTTVTLTSTGVVEDDGLWHFVALSSVGATDHKMYVCTTSSCDAAISNTATTTTTYAEINLARFNPNVSSQITGDFDGMVDEFQFYSVSMSAGDVTTQFNSGTGTETALANAVAQYHLNLIPAEQGTQINRCDFDEINYWIQPGDLVSAESVPTSPGYQSDRTDSAFAGDLITYGDWYDITTNGTAANPIVIRCEDAWPSGCRMGSRIDIEANYVWIWGFWFTGFQGFNIGGSGCAGGSPISPSSDDGPSGVTLGGIGTAAINNWFYHPPDLPTYLDGGGNPIDGRAGGFSSQQTASPAPIWYGNIFHKGAHGIYAQNRYEDSGYMYFIQNIINDPNEVIQCNGSDPTKVSTANKMGAFWSTSNDVQGMYVYHNFFADTEGVSGANDWFMVTQGDDPQQFSIVDSNHFFCGGRMITPPSNGNISFGTGNGVGIGAAGTGHPSQAQFTNNYAASCSLEIPYFWADGETIHARVLPNEYTDNTILVDPTIDTETVYLRTSAYTALGREDGRLPIEVGEIFDRNTYITGATFRLRANSNLYSGRTFTQWKADTETESTGTSNFDINSTASTTYPVTGSLAVMYKNEYDPLLGNLIIYNWAEAATVDVNFTAVCPLCSRFNLYSAHGRPDDPAVLSNQVNVGDDIAVPMDGDLVRTFRIQVISE